MRWRRDPAATACLDAWEPYEDPPAQEGFFETAALDRTIGVTLYSGVLGMADSRGPVQLGNERKVAAARAGQAGA